MGGKTYLTNAFSLSMLPPAEEVTIQVRRVSTEEVRRILENSPEIISAVGHEASSSFLKKLLGKEIQTNRISISIQKDDILIVFQLLVRLPETKILSESELQNMEYRFYLVQIKNFE